MHQIVVFLIIYEIEYLWKNNTQMFESDVSFLLEYSDVLCVIYFEMKVFRCVGGQNYVKKL